LTIDVFGKEKFRPAYRDRVQKLENTASSFMVYFSLNEKSFPYYNYNIYEHFSYDCWNSINDNSENWPHTLYVCTPASSKSEEFAESVCVMCYMNLKDVAEWEDTYNTTIDPSERNAAYLQFKKDKEEQIIKRLETRYPDFRSCIKNVYSSTPLTYRDYIGTPEGSLYGIKKDYNNPIGTTINSKTRVPNLYLTGQNIIFHGILGATIGAFVTCFNFVNHIEIIKKINEYEK
jgi:all-trans-retinol 13,14-reductase